MTPNDPSWRLRRPTGAPRTSPPRLAGLAALGLTGVMVGAVVTQVLVLDSVVMALTPAFLGTLFGLIAWRRWPQTKAPAGKPQR